MKLRYVGPLPEVYVMAHDEFLDISVGDVVEFADDLAVDLLGQEGNWEAADAKSKKFLNDLRVFVDAVDEAERVALAEAQAKAAELQAEYDRLAAEEEAFEDWLAEQTSALRERFEQEREAQPEDPPDPT